VSGDGRDRAVAVVTGASSGIGREIALRIAADGWSIALVARRRDRLEELAAEIRAAFGTDVHVIPADLADPEGPARVEAEAARLDLDVELLVNNAGFGSWGSFADRELELQLDALRVNVLALTELSRRFLPAMQARGRGRILNVASTAAFQPGPGAAVYYASKAYVLHFSEALHEELRGSGVTVTALCPGPTVTEFQERAGISRALVGRGPLLMKAGPVAEAGYRGAMRGVAIVVPGLLNRIGSRLPRITPRFMARRIVSRLNAER
jgi:short-subunit dehydrogenase